MVYVILNVALLLFKNDYTVDFTHFSIGIIIFDNRIKTLNF